jgi:hypothetical protein
MSDEYYRWSDCDTRFGASLGGPDPDVEELEQRIERLEAALVALVEHSPVEEMRMGGYACIYCQAEHDDYYAVVHLESCPHLRAASLIQTSVKTSVETT